MTETKHYLNTRRRKSCRYLLYFCCICKKNTQIFHFFFLIWQKNTTFATKIIYSPRTIYF